jgi:hypothetical protein
VIATDPHADAAANPDHAHDEHGGLLYDARCFWCRDITAQPPPGTPKAAAS